MLIRSKAPLRLSLGGGGTDVSPYCDEFGGSILNSTISMYAYASIQPLYDDRIIFEAIDIGKRFSCQATDYIEPVGELALLKGIYNRIVRDFNNGEPLSFKLTTHVDAPPGSGLGSSSTLVVAVIGAFVEWLGLPLGEYEIAHLAYEIERLDLGFAGGKQDQYAATFGGFNFMEFYANDKVIVNPLRIKPEIVDELEYRIVLYYTGTSRLSSRIIEAQVKNVQSREKVSIEAMHKLKEQAYLMKEALLKGKIEEIGVLLDYGWQHKKVMANGITNEVIEEIYETAKKAGAIGGKISGAGGGGYMMLFCEPEKRFKVMEALEKFGGEFRDYHFTNFGLRTWIVR